MAVSFPADFVLGPLRYLDTAQLEPSQRRAVFRQYEETTARLTGWMPEAKLALCRFERRREEPECDYSLPGGHFSLHRVSDGEFFGTWALYNIRVERETRRLVQATASPVCHPVALDFEGLARRAARILDQWLSEEIPLADGRRLDLVAWEFPPGRWQGVREMEILEELSHRRMDREGGRIRRIRR